MSTRREGGPEKRGTSPSPGGATERRRSPAPAKTSSNESTQSTKTTPSYLRPTASSSLSASDALKPKLNKKGSPFAIDTPNDNPALLRRRSFDKPPSPSRSSAKSPNPTLRSSSFSGKTAVDQAANKALARRRSFDKPPSPSRSAKSPVSPSPTTRSSSFSGRTNTSQKVASERSSRGPKDAGKQHTLYARPVSTGKKSSVLTRKSGTGSGSARKERAASTTERVENHNAGDVLELETQSFDHESFLSEEECGFYNEKELGDPVLEEQETSNIVDQIEGEIQDLQLVSNNVDQIIDQIEGVIQDLQIATNTVDQSEAEGHDKNGDMESPTVSEQHDETNIVDRTEGERHDHKSADIESTTISEQHDEVVGSPTITENLQEDENVNPSTDSVHENVSLGENKEEKEGTSQEEPANEVHQTDTVEGAAGEPNEEAGREEDGENEEAITHNNKEEEGENEEAITQDNKQEVTEQEEATTQNNNDEVDGGSECRELDEKEAEDAHGKKDLTLSNNAIEETANKLTEKRQNKVKALAGAFESVISSQDNK